MLKGIKAKINKPINRAAEKCKALISSISSLIDIVQKENNLIEQGLVSGIGLLIEKKLKITREVEQDYLELMSYREELKTLVDQAQIDKIKDLYIKLDELSQYNLILLQSSMEVTNMMVQIQKEKQIAKTIDQYGYDNKGKITALDKLEKIVPAISLNNKI